MQHAQLETAGCLGAPAGCCQCRPSQLSPNGACALTAPLPSCAARDTCTYTLRPPSPPTSLLLCSSRACAPTWSSCASSPPRSATPPATPPPSLWSTSTMRRTRVRPEAQPGGGWRQKRLTLWPCLSACQGCSTLLSPCTTEDVCCLPWPPSPCCAPLRPCQSHSPCDLLMVTPCTLALLLTPNLCAATAPAPGLTTFAAAAAAPCS